VAAIRLNRLSIVVSIGSVGVPYKDILYLKAYCMYRWVKEGPRCLIQPGGGEGKLPFLRYKWSKGGTQVRGATENYRTAYLMCVLYAFVIIVLAAVFLL
jgi:hypothetical protein